MEVGGPEQAREHELDQYVTRIRLSFFTRQLSPVESVHLSPVSLPQIPRHKYLEGLALLLEFPSREPFPPCREESWALPIPPF